jgi:2-oxoglutarate dehydrogenase E1 component
VSTDFLFQLPLELVEEFYDRYQNNPITLDDSWVQFFDQLKDKQFTIPCSEAIAGVKDNAVYCLIEAYRQKGFMYTSYDSETNISKKDQDLNYQNFGLGTEDLKNTFGTFGLIKSKQASLNTIIDELEKKYCGAIGFEYKTLNDYKKIKWFENLIQEGLTDLELQKEDALKLFDYLNRANTFENFLHTKFVGQKRFSLEGAETLIGMLKFLIEASSKKGVNKIALAMPHRGRLNVLANVLNKSYNLIFSEFEDILNHTSMIASGDVKYHKGFQSSLKLDENTFIDLYLIANPSHLESVDPILEGFSKGLQVKEEDKQKNSVLPIIIHGDASIAGQGVVYETLQLQSLHGYETKGTIHIVLNNHIGFTTTPKDYMSTTFCTDIAKTFSNPVLHVNANHPLSCILAIKIANLYRYNFGGDIFINLNCYRKYGHNEIDEPFFTQPGLYTRIQNQVAINEIFAKELIKKKYITLVEQKRMFEDYNKFLHEELVKVKIEDPKLDFHLVKKRAEEINLIYTPSLKIPSTEISNEQFNFIINSITKYPENFNIHPKLRKFLTQRNLILNESLSKPSIDWSLAETIAFASLLLEKKHVRLSGEDSRRGTFSQRHSCFIDQINEKKYFPLNHLSKDQGRFDVFNSPLSEFAVLGFEYGYSLSYQDALVIWEAQFGDFVNEAQVILDQYLSSGEQKWDYKTRLTLFLPHGFEGQGPEHSSARIERFLQIAGDNNLFLTNPTTPSQFFHLLRRQAHLSEPKPLIVFTPKSLLRLKDCLSKPSEFLNGQFKEILDDELNPLKAKTLIFCSGRIYYNLVKEREKRDKKEQFAIIRIEQFYPLNILMLKDIVSKYYLVDSYLFVQEEPKNMGLWFYIKTHIREIIAKELKLNFVGRKQKASPAVGSYKIDNFEYEEIINEVFK